MVCYFQAFEKLPVRKVSQVLSFSPPLQDLQDDEDPLIIDLISEERQKLPPEAFLDFGPSLPRCYGVDRLELMMQSPLRVFAYWELRESTILAALRGIPVYERQNFQLLLRWNQKDAGRELSLDPGTTDNWWFDTLPENRYQLELGLFWSEHGWLPLLASDELVTPRVTLGPAEEEEPPHTRALLEELVQQTGIGLTQDRDAPPPLTEPEEPLPELAAIPAGTTQAIGPPPEQPIGGATESVPRRLRPASSWAIRGSTRFEP